MKKIEVFDPALCCASGVCGVDTDQALVTFAADVDWIRQRGGAVERFNLAQQPLVFAENAIIKGFLEGSGADALPVTLIDGEIALAGRYPTREELSRWLAIEPSSTGLAIAKGCCSGGGCC